jgi:hypothetical protein
MSVNEIKSCRCRGFYFMSVLANKVFTPSTPAILTFVERESINARLVDSIRIPGKQLIVYGHTGSGKTTLVVNKLTQLYPTHLTTRCVKGMSFQQIVLDAFDQLAPYYVESSDERKGSRIDAKLAGVYLGIKSELGVGKILETAVSSARVLPPQLTIQTLARLIGAAECCWVLEDFHKIAIDEKTHLAQAMKVFMDMAIEFSTLKIIAIGAVDTARDVVIYDPEMRNRVSEIRVPLMDAAELEQILDKGQKYLNITFSSALKKGVVHYSNGLASVCHSLGLSLCLANGIEATAPQRISLGESSLNRAIDRYMEDASDTLKGIFDKAFRSKRKTKYANFEIMVQALSQFDQEGATKNQLLDKIREKLARYPVSNFEYCLRSLQSDDRGSLIRIDSSGKICFIDPIYRAFSLAFFNKSSTSKAIQLTFDDVFGRALFKQLNLEILHYVAVKETPKVANKEED